MNQEFFSISVEIAAILIAGLIILRMIPLMNSGKKRMTTALFLFAMVSLQLSLSYWLVYTLIRHDVRMPIAANEIGEAAMFLLLASTLETVFSESRISAKREVYGTMLFSAASIALWIAWSGEWIQDIVGGVAYGYFLCRCVRSLKQSNALSRNEWRFLGLFSGTIILGHTMAFLTPESYKHVVDNFCYLLMFTLLLWLVIKAFLHLRTDGDSKVKIALAFSSCGLSLSTMYMSEKIFYYVANLLFIFSTAMMLRAIESEVES